MPAGLKGTRGGTVGAVLCLFAPEVDPEPPPSNEMRWGLLGGQVAVLTVFTDAEYHQLRPAEQLWAMRGPHGLWQRLRIE